MGATVSWRTRLKAAWQAAVGAWHAGEPARPTVGAAMPEPAGAAPEEDTSRLHVQRQNDILRAVTESLPATVVIVDSTGRYRFVNSAFERLVGRPARGILGRTAAEVLGAAEVARRQPYMQRAFAGESVDFTLEYPSEEGSTFLALSCIPLKVDGAFDGFVGISQDITAQRREQQRLAHLAERDPLTGLFNRTGLSQRLDDERRRPDAGPIALLYIDLDHFKPVNDRMGHLAGDRVLQLFARRLVQAVRSTDVVARVGGDEFAILLAGMHDLRRARIVADKVLCAAERPFEVDGVPVSVGASIGVAVLPPEQASLRALLAQADVQLYRAKSAGRGQFCTEFAELTD